MKHFSAVLVVSLLVGCVPTSGSGGAVSSVPAVSVPSSAFGASVAYEETPAPIAEGVSAPVNIADIQNLDELQDAYGFTLTAAQRATLAKNAFVMMPLSQTSLRPRLGSEHGREFLGLYNTVRGDSVDYKNRTQANAVFLSSDLFFHSYNLLYTELLKEMENQVFFPSMKDLSATLYAAAAKNAASASGDDAHAWRAVRNYFAVPYALLSTAKMPLASGDYMDGGAMRDPSGVDGAFATQDATADTIDTATAFVKELKLDAASEAEVLADLRSAYDASGRAVPAIFKDEYEQYAQDTGVRFFVDFTQFTPRSHYTGSSLRRQYFRAMMWFSQVPFFLKSPALTTYAFKASQVLAEHPAQLEAYAKLESTINFLVGASDDLMPVDYLSAVEAAKDMAAPEPAMMEYLVNARPPKIKSLPAYYPTVGDAQTADVLLLTKGMRFFSGKFIIDSYWTGQLTQGDEAVLPGYTQKLPPMASSLEVLSLLGSDYATKKIPTLDFYKPETREAIDQMMAQLRAETQSLDPSFWTANVYNGWLWTIRSLFEWQSRNVAALPRFMQGDLWPAKTLMTAAGFWTELRHATLLYAKQSFAELGGGPGGCDPRDVPESPKGYIEPNIQAFDRLSYLAKRTAAGLRELGFDELRNLQALDNFVGALGTVRTYTAKQLANEQLKEVVTSHEETDDYGKTCTVHTIDGSSDWEVLRVGIVNQLFASLPVPVEGPVLSNKDKRAALIADVHTGGDSANPTKILYEATGVPNVILVAVNDANGPRLTIGFTYAQYEFTEEYGGKRMTDEDWQKRFYEEGDDPYDAFRYTTPASHPVVPSWFAPLFVR